MDFEEIKEDIVAAGTIAIGVIVIIILVIGIGAGSVEMFRIIGSYTSCIRPSPDMIKHCDYLNGD